MTYVNVICICMYLWGVAVLQLDRHPDNNKGPDPHTLRWSTDPSHRMRYVLCHGREYASELLELCLLDFL